MPLAKKSDNFQAIGTSIGRYYHSEKYPDLWMPSVTTIIGRAKNKDRKPSKPGAYGGPAAPIGSLVHYKCLKPFSKIPLDMPYDPIWGLTEEEKNRRISECCRMWYELINPLDIKPIAVERIVYSRHPRYCGRIDMLCKIDGILTLLDIKTGAVYDEHPLQAAAYWHALKRKPKQVQFYYMDAIEGRNPSKCGHIATYYKDELEMYYEEFLNVFADYDGLMAPLDDQGNLII